MLVLSRKIDEVIVIGGNVRITVSSIVGRNVRLAIEAPRDILILREEILGIAKDEGVDKLSPIVT